MDLRPRGREALRRVNERVARATGFEVRRVVAPAAASPQAPAARAPSPQRRAAQPARRGQAKKSGPRAKQGRLDPSKHYDAEANALIEQVRPRTMTSPEKLFPLIEAVRHVTAAGVEGDFVECGVWRGGSMQAMAWTLLGLGVDDRELHLFDTFEGMPPPTDDDRRTRDGASAEDLLREHDQSHRVWAYAGLDDVREGMAETGYPSERIHLVQGMVEDTIPARAPGQIAILRLDTDWYASTKHSLEQLYPRLVPGGVLLLDDYGAWEGARKATEEYLASIDDHLLLLPMAEGRVAIKPLRSEHVHR